MGWLAWAGVVYGTGIGVPSIGALGGGAGPPSFFENLQTGPPSFLKNNRLLDGTLKLATLL